MDRQQVQVRGGGIRLGQLLKLAGLVETGGEAKLRIVNGEALVNGVVETRRGRQLVNRDLIEFAGIVLEVAEE